MSSIGHTLSDIHTLTSKRDFDDLALCLANIVVNHMRTNKVSVYRTAIHYDELHVMPIVSPGARRKHGTQAKSLQRYPALAACQQQQEFVAVRRPAPATSQFVFPLFWGATLAGFIEINSRRFTRSQRNLIENWLLVFHNHTRLLEENERDMLTGLLNRKTFETSILRIMAETRAANSDQLAANARPQRRGVNRSAGHWLAVVDIDHFKRINDTYGHLYGDEVLLLVSNIMRKSFRSNDRLFRFGGEEFVILLAPCNAKNANMVLERFRRNIEAWAFPQIESVTVSIGFTRIHDGDVPSSVIGHADEALYYTKKNGRNRVCSYEKLQSEHKVHHIVDHTDVEYF